MEVALATRGIPKGTVVDREMISVIKRPVLSRENFAEPDQVIGRVAKRDIASNEVVLSNAVASPADESHTDRQTKRRPRRDRQTWPKRDSPEKRQGDVPRQCG